MANDSKCQPVPMREGYQPKPKPGERPIDPRTLKPPRGGSSVQPPKPSTPKPSR
jgi:hypothetical protein